MPDYPLDNADMVTVRAYRQALRDLPQQDGAPWDGGGEETPWPVLAR
ncbi:phage tail assembly chaperone [Desulfovibrio porci]